MIGVIQGNRVFEFREESELAKALSWFADKYGCETLLIIDSKNTVKGVINGNSFTFTPSLNADQKYYLFGVSGNKYSDLSKNEPLPIDERNWEINYMTFEFCNITVPKILDLY